MTGTSAYFVLPTFSVSPTYCVLENFNVSSSDTSMSTSADLDQPTLVGTNYHVVPKSTSDDSSYKFYLWVTANGGKQA